MSFYAMSQSPGGTVKIVGSVAGNVHDSGGDTHDLGSFDVGAASGDKNALMLLTTHDGSDVSIVTFKIGTVTLTEEIVFKRDLGSDFLQARIFTGDISSLSGSQAIEAIYDGSTDSSGVSGVAVSGLNSLTPTNSDTTGTVVGTDPIVMSGISAESGGIAVGVQSSSGQANSTTWEALTEQADVEVSGGGGHRHSATWDIFPAGRSSADEDITQTGSIKAAIVASFR